MVVLVGTLDSTFMFPRLKCSASSIHHKNISLSIRNLFNMNLHIQATSSHIIHEEGDHVGISFLKIKGFAADRW